MASDTQQQAEMPQTTPQNGGNGHGDQHGQPFGQPFVNPFLTPFLPQAVDSTAGGIFLSASQYQELMQYYFKSLAAASSNDKTQPMASTLKLADEATTGPSTSEEHRINGKTNDDDEATTGPSTSEEHRANGKANDDDDEAATESGNEENLVNGVSSIEQPLEDEQQPAKMMKDAIERRQSDIADTRASVLIKKQMNEIDKEINRRSQNKNIKKGALVKANIYRSVQIDAVEVAQLLQSGKPDIAATFADQSALPYTAHPEPFVSSPTPSGYPSVNSTSLYQAHFPQQPQSPAMMMTMPFQPQMQSPMMPMFMPHIPPQQSFVTPEMAAAFLQQWQQSVEAAAAPLAQPVQQPAVPSGQPPPMKDTTAWPGEHSVSETMKPSGAEKKVEEEEAVWVMRETYKERLKRDQQRATDEANREQQIDDSEAECSAPLNADEPDDMETDKLLTAKEKRIGDECNRKKTSKKEVMVHEPAVLIEGVLFRARYLGSTQLVCDGRPSKTSRMMQAQEAVARVKAPEGELQPSTDIDLFISTEKIMVLNTDLQRISDTDVRQDILMDHALRSISYIADIGDLVVLMARRMSSSSSEEECNENGVETIRRTPRIICHVFESDEASFIAQSIGQAFQVAYVEFLRANGIDDPSYLREIDYQEVLNSQELMGEELEMFARKETQKDIVVPKKAGESLGVQVVESGWGSMLPTVVIAKIATGGPAARCNLLNIGDQVIAINGISLVGLPLASAQQNIKNARTSTAVKLTVVSTPPVVEVRIKRPDTKYQLGFSVQNGVICSLLRGGIAERGGIRVGHRIIEINGMSVVAVAHERIVNMLATAIGEIQMKTMPTSMYRLMTGQETPNYI